MALYKKNRDRVFGSQRAAVAMLVAALLGGCAFSQIPPGIAIAEVNAKEAGSEVVVDARLVQKLDGNTWLARDATGDIVVSISPEVMGQNWIAPSEIVRLAGEIERSEGRTWLQVERLKIIEP